MLNLQINYQMFYECQAKKAGFRIKSPVFSRHFEMAVLVWLLVGNLRWYQLYHFKIYLLLKYERFSFCVLVIVESTNWLTI